MRLLMLLKDGLRGVFAEHQINHAGSSRTLKTLLSSLLSPTIPLGHTRAVFAGAGPRLPASQQRHSHGQPGLLSGFPVASDDVGRAGEPRALQSRQYSRRSDRVVPKAAQQSTNPGDQAALRRQKQWPQNDNNLHPQTWISEPNVVKSGSQGRQTTEKPGRAPTQTEKAAASHSSPSGEAKPASRTSSSHQNRSTQPAAASTSQQVPSAEADGLAWTRENKSAPRQPATAEQPGVSRHKKVAQEPQADLQQVQQVEWQASRQQARQAAGPSTEQPEQPSQLVEPAVEQEHGRQQPGTGQSSMQRPSASIGSMMVDADDGQFTLRDLLRQRCHGLTLRSYQPGDHNGNICPRCHGGTSSEPSFNIQISPNGRSAAWKCHRKNCNLRGGASLDASQQGDKGSRGSASSHSPQNDESSSAGSTGSAPASAATPELNLDQLQPLGPELLQFFSGRGISEATLQRNRVMQALRFSRKHNGKVPFAAFPYFRSREIVNIKYRSAHKEFTQTKGGERLLYGYDDCVGQHDVIVVEGEMDKLAFEEAGYTNVVSVPDGATNSRATDEFKSVPEPHADKQFAFLWGSREIIDGVRSFVIATDNDSPGNALAEELARRVGKGRCYRLKLPGEPASASPPAQVAQMPPTFADGHANGHAAANGAAKNGAAAQQQQQQQTAEALQEAAAQAALYRKDANEVLMKDGAEALRKLVESVEPFPVQGLFETKAYREKVLADYYGQGTESVGVHSGWHNLNEFYRVVPGEMTVVTGVPNSGKSEWLDALLVNLARSNGWQFAMCSMEKAVHLHIRQLLEKHVGKPFLDAAMYSHGLPRMTIEEVDAGIDWLQSRFYFIRREDEQMPNIDWILAKAEVAVLRYGVRGLVIDPYNELDHQRDRHVSETEYVSKMLTRIKNFAQYNGVHVWFVAHPRQLQQWTGQAPGLYDISGSAHFVNKADNGITIDRKRDPPTPEVRVLVQKVRNKAAGKLGTALLKYQVGTGRYSDLEGVEEAAAPRHFG